MGSRTTTTVPRVWVPPPSPAECSWVRRASGTIRSSPCVDAPTRPTRGFQLSPRCGPVPRLLPRQPHRVGAGVWHPHPLRVLGRANADGRWLEPAYVGNLADPRSGGQELGGQQQCGRDGVRVGRRKPSLTRPWHSWGGQTGRAHRPPLEVIREQWTSRLPNPAPAGQAPPQPLRRNTGC